MTRVSDIEKAMAKEAKDAKRWLRQHEHELPPVVVPEPQVVSASGAVLKRTVPIPEGFESWAEVWEEAAKFKPLTARPRTVDLVSAEMSKRVRHVLSFVPPPQAELLQAYYVERASPGEMLERFGAGTRQALHERLGWARQAFERAWLAHAEDPIELTEED